MAVSDAAILLSEKKATIEIEIKRDSPLYQIQNVTLDKPKSGELMPIIIVIKGRYTKTAKLSIFLRKLQGLES